MQENEPLKTQIKRKNYHAYLITKSSQACT